MKVCASWTPRKRLLLMTSLVGEWQVRYLRTLMSLAKRIELTLVISMPPPWNLPRNSAIPLRICSYSVTYIYSGSTPWRSQGRKIEVNFGWYKFTFTYNTIQYFGFSLVNGNNIFRTCDSRSVKTMTLSKYVAEYSQFRKWIAKFLSKVQGRSIKITTVNSIHLAKLIIYFSISYLLPVTYLWTTILFFNFRIPSVTLYILTIPVGSLVS